MLLLLVMLHVSAGLPMIHPLFHAHDEARAGAGRLSEKSLNKSTNVQPHSECPVCDHLATHQMHPALSVAGVVENEAIDVIPFKTPQRSTGARINSIEARAPPINLLFS